MNPEIYKIDPSLNFIDCYFQDFEVADPAVAVPAGMVMYKDSKGKMAPWAAMSSNVAIFVAAQTFTPGTGQTKIKIAYSGKVVKSFLKFPSGDWTTVTAGKTAFDNFIVFSQIIPVGEV